MVHTPAILLRAQNLHLGLPGLELAPGAELCLEAGERAVLVGPSGSGKSTVLRALVGLAPGRADVSIEQRSAEEVGLPRFRRLVSWVPQLPVLLAGSVQEELRRPFRYAAAGGQPFDESKARGLLDELGIGAQWKTDDVRHLSVGEQQRLCLTRALLLKPRVLLLDEPTAALDAAAKVRVLELLRGWNDETGGALLMVSHDELSIGKNWASRIVRMEELRNAG